MRATCEGCIEGVCPGDTDSVEGGRGKERMECSGPLNGKSEKEYLRELTAPKDQGTVYYMCLFLESCKGDTCVQREVACLVYF